MVQRQHTERRSSPPGATAPRRAAALVALAVLLGLAGSLALTSPAAADDFAVSSYSDGQFVSGNEVTLAGTGDEGAQIRVTVPGTPACTTAVADGDWTCDLTLPNGAITLTVVQHRADASAGAAPTPSPSPTGRSWGRHSGDRTITLTLHVLGAPTIAGGGTIVTASQVTGSGYPGAVIVLAAGRPGDDPPEIGCPPVAADGSWTCPIDLPSGDYTVSARQYAPGHPEQSSPSSGERALLVDRDAPSAPVILSPSPRARVSTGTAVAGTGEDGASVSVFANGSLVCNGAVAGGRWTCTADRLPGGRVQLQAVQRDAVGNYSAPSNPIELIVSAGAGVPVPAPSPSPVSPTPVPSTAPPPGGSSTGSGTSASPQLSPRGWSAPSGFGSSLPAVATALDGQAWVIGLVAAGIFIVLIALPLRLLQTAAVGRVHLPRILGRNQRLLESERVRDGWLPLAGLLVGVGVVAAILALVLGQNASVRLIVAVVVGLAVLNAVGVVLAGALAARAEGARRALRIVPAVLLVGVVGALLSRALGIEPPIVVGVVLASAAASMSGPRAGAVIQLAQLGALELLAVTAWIARDLIGPGVGVWGVGLGEALAAVTISGLCSTAVLLLPVGRMPGRAIYDWSRPAWCGSAILAVGVAAVILGQGHGISAALALGAAAIVAAASVGAWAWFRWVDPALTGR